MNVEQFGGLAGRVVARLAKQVELGIAGEELSLPQYRLLGMLAEGSAASSKLAERMAVRPPSVTSLVDGLVARGLVERHADPADRRRLPLELTAAGQVVLDRANAAVGARLKDVLGNLAGDEATTVRRSVSLWQEALDAHRDRQPRKVTA
jgi:long-chain acyl-CoA synthetase